MAYRDHKYSGSSDELERDLTQSTTLYVGNLSFFTTEEQIYDLFSKVGEIKRIIMGLDRYRCTPCGFCFVEYYTREDAADCIRYINGTRLDDRVIRTDWDAGFKEGRQYGRGKSGGQVRDEYRTDYDPGRGGYGKQVQRKPLSYDPGDFHPISPSPTSLSSSSSSLPLPPLNSPSSHSTAAVLPTPHFSGFPNVVSKTILPSPPVKPKDMNTIVSNTPTTAIPSTNKRPLSDNSESSTDEPAKKKFVQEKNPRFRENESDEEED